MKFNSMFGGGGNLPYGMTGDALINLGLSHQASSKNPNAGGNVFDQYAGSTLNKALDPLDLFGGSNKANVINWQADQARKYASMLRDPTKLTPAPNGQMTQPTVQMPQSGDRQYALNKMKQIAQQLQAGGQP